MEYFVWKNSADRVIVVEPWYQYAIDAGMVVAAPLIGAYVAEAAEDMHRDFAKGFAGINRAHLALVRCVPVCHWVDHTNDADLCRPRS